MSLINQALRKAQRDRTPNRMPQPGEQSPAAYANSSASGMSPKLVIGLIIAVAVLVGLVAGLSIIVFKDGDTSPAQNVAATPPVTPSPAPAPLTDSPAVSPPVDLQMAPPVAAAPVVPENAPAPSVVEELRKARVATEVEAAAQAEAAAAKIKAAEAATARETAKPSEDIIEWLSSAKVTGVRLSETESKIILNGNTYGVGDYVNFKLGLKVMVIQETRILFMDKNGKKYMKRI